MRDGFAQVLLWMWPRSGHTAISYGLDTGLRRADGVSGSLHRQLELQLPISLLDKAQQCHLGVEVAGKQGYDLGIFHPAGLKTMTEVTVIDNESIYVQSTRAKDPVHAILKGLWLAVNYPDYNC